MKLHFLGTGGGRFVTASQKRKTAGTLLETSEGKILIDPGPGSLREIQNYDTSDLIGLIVTHGHIDHYNDTEAVIEHITELKHNHCTLMGSESVLNGYGDIGKCVSDYHQGLCNSVVNLSEKDGEIGNLEVEAQEMDHADPKTVGLKVTEENDSIGFWIDSNFSEKLTGFYDDCDTFIVNCVFSRNSNSRNHTTVSDVPNILENSEASTVILKHFGKSMLEADMDEEEAWLKEQVDQKVIFAEDGMSYPGDRSLSSF
jgi:ribonuclease BN (tRNA processing enzyme)